MVLTSKFRIVGIKKKTQAQFFKGLQVGDVVELEYALTGHYKGSPYIKIKQDGVKVHTNNALQLQQNLECFEIEVI